jgi:AraC-like DNA-binding protein
MYYHTYPGPPDLSHLVRFFWSLESEDHGAHPYRLIAETCPNIVFVLRGGFVEADGSECPPAHLAGALSGPMNMVAHGPFTLIGVYLWPWALRTYFQLGPGRCMDRVIDLKEFWGSGADQLVKAIPTATVVGDRVDLITSFLLTMSLVAQPDDVLGSLVMGIHTSDTAPGVEALIAKSGLSRRSFERRFKDCTGFSPATYLRILCFQGTYRMLENGTARSLTDIALASGYFDQSHFIREFKRFSGLNPKDYFLKAKEKVDNFVRVETDQKIRQ